MALLRPKNRSDELPPEYGICNKYYFLCFNGQNCQINYRPLLKSEYFLW